MLVVASGPTELRALPHLLRHLLREGVNSIDVRTPPAGRPLNVEVAGKLARGAYWEGRGREETPDKVVVLIDADAQSVEDATERFSALPSHLRDLPVTVYVAAAKWHLEAWFFADSASLRDSLGRSLGHIDVSAPDQIGHPKNHLRQLLGDEIYTARVAERIASAVSPIAIRERSPSFRAFENTVRDGR